MSIQSVPIDKLQDFLSLYRSWGDKLVNYRHYAALRSYWEKMSSDSQANEKETLSMAKKMGFSRIFNKITGSDDVKKMTQLLSFSQSLLLQLPGWQRDNRRGMSRRIEIPQDLKQEQVYKGIVPPFQKRKSKSTASFELAFEEAYQLQVMLNDMVRQILPELERCLEIVEQSSGDSSSQQYALMNQVREWMERIDGVVEKYRLNTPSFHELNELMIKIKVRTVDMVLFQDTQGAAERPAKIVEANGKLHAVLIFEKMQNNEVLDSKENGGLMRNCRRYEERLDEDISVFEKMHNNIKDFYKKFHCVSRYVYDMVKDTHEVMQDILNIAKELRPRIKMYFAKVIRFFRDLLNKIDREDGRGMVEVVNPTEITKIMKYFDYEVPRVICLQSKSHWGKLVKKIQRLFMNIEAKISKKEPGVDWMAIRGSLREQIRKEVYSSLLLIKTS